MLEKKQTALFANKTAHEQLPGPYKPGTTVPGTRTICHSKAVSQHPGRSSWGEPTQRCPTEHPVHTPRVTAPPPTSTDGGTSLPGRKRRTEACAPFAVASMDCMAQVYARYCDLSELISSKVTVDMIVALKVPMERKYACPSVTIWRRSIQTFIAITEAAFGDGRLASRLAKEYDEHVPVSKGTLAKIFLQCSLPWAGIERSNEV